MNAERGHGWRKWQPRIENPEGRWQRGAAVDPLIIELIRLRMRQGLSQSDVATRMGLTALSGRNTVGGFESGRTSPRLDTLRRWLNALGANLTVSGDVPRERPEADGVD